MNIFGLVFTILLILKLTGIGMVATWSWIWVFLPLWLPFVAYFGFMVMMPILAAIGGAIVGFIISRK